MRVATADAFRTLSETLWNEVLQDRRRWLKSATKFYLILAICTLTLFQLPIATEPPCTGFSNDNFIRAAGSHLCLNGQPLKMVGANSYGVLGGYLGIGYINNQTPASPVRLKQAASAGLRAIRFWLDVTNSDYWFPLAYSKFEQDSNHSAYFSALDRLVVDAKASGVYLVPVLVSAYDQWTALGHGESFWKIGTETNLKFKDWAKAIVKRYSGDPQIAWWEIANEPNYSVVPNPGGTTLDTLTLWAHDILTLVKELDTMHLVSGGFNNTGNLDLSMFDKLNRPFDLASLHIYENDLYSLERGKGIVDKELAISDFVKRYSSYAENVLRKPLVFGEFNSDATTPSPWFVDRFLHQALSNAAAALIWVWEEGSPSATYYVSLDTTPRIVETLRMYSNSLRTTGLIPDRTIESNNH